MIFCTGDDISISLKLSSAYTQTETLFLRSWWVQWWQNGRLYLRNCTGLVSLVAKRQKQLHQAIKIHSIQRFWIKISYFNIRYQNIPRNLQITSHQQIANDYSFTRQSRILNSVARLPRSRHQNYRRLCSSVRTGPQFSGTSFSFVTTRPAVVAELKFWS